jgi:protein SCO1/2
MGSWFWTVLASSACVGLVGCAAHAGLPSYAVVPDFTLTDQSGASFQSAQKLHDTVWIADFIFTTCSGPCPRMTSQMHQVQTALAGVDNVRLVSFTVDPDRDTPDVLAAYATKFQANPARWSFLTGSAADLNHLSRNVFMLGNVDGKLEHSTRFVLIDRKSRVRGFYLTSEENAIPRLVADAKSLATERY